MENFLCTISTLHYREASTLSQGVPGRFCWHCRVWRRKQGKVSTLGLQDRDIMWYSKGEPGQSHLGVTHALQLINLSVNISKECIQEAFTVVIFSQLLHVYETQYRRHALHLTIDINFVLLLQANSPRPKCPWLCSWWRLNCRQPCLASMLMWSLLSAHRNGGQCVFLSA